MTVSLCIFSLLHYYALWPASIPLCLLGCLTTSSNVLSVRLRESELSLHLPSSIVAFINGNIYMYFEGISQVFKRKKGHYDRIYFFICSIPPEYIRLKEQSWPAEKQERRNFLFDLVLSGLSKQLTLILDSVVTSKLTATDLHTVVSFLKDI